MSQFRRRILFALFFLSGFCGLLYQVVWVRLAFASFGIILPILSVVVSVFMLGLSLGAWAGGRAIKVFVRKSGRSALWFYAVIEVLIGIGAFMVPKLFALGERLLLSAGETDSARYLLLSAVLLGISILPWSFFMGTTFPFMMAFVREQDERNEESFSFLYLANVLGAMSGTLLTALVLIEIFGFRHTLWFAAAANFLIAAVACLLCWNQGRFLPLKAELAIEAKPIRYCGQSDSLILWILFATGFAAMGMEMVWARAFTPILKTQVYSFALILFVYLGATFLGTWIYRRDLQRQRIRSAGTLFSILSVVAFLPIVLTDFRLFPRFETENAGWPGALILFSICPICALLGYLTPSLIDKYGSGDPSSAGAAYGLNVLGCILGPLAAAYVLLPWVGERCALTLLGLPFVVFFLITTRSLSMRRRLAVGMLAAAAVVWSLFCSVDFTRFAARNAVNVEIRRDYAASVVSAGRDLRKQLYVNGISMTAMVPETKFMAHLPLAFHAGKPESALIICFGMGTTYRSALRWGIETTAVELVPSVKSAFSFYHADAKEVLADPRGRIVIDDGRRYLARSREKFDLIVVDPPPPVEAAGSSLLYSVEFYELAKAHLKRNGIVVAWFPGDDVATRGAIVRSVADSFPYVRCFQSVEDWGLHVFASMEPIPDLSAEDLEAKMPRTAAKDLLEWSSSSYADIYLQEVLAKEMPLSSVLNSDPKIRVTDDRPYNEYFLLRLCRAHLAN